MGIMELEVPLKNTKKLPYQDFFGRTEIPLGRTGGGVFSRFFMQGFHAAAKYENKGVLVGRGRHWAGSCKQQCVELGLISLTCPTFLFNYNNYYIYVYLCKRYELGLVGQSGGTGRF